MSTTQASSIKTESNGGRSAAMKESAHFESSGTTLPVRVRRAGRVEAADLPGVDAISASDSFKAWDTSADVALPAGRASVWELRGIWLGLIAFAVAGLGEA